MLGVTKTIKIRIGTATALGELNNSPTAALIWEELPFEGEVRRWGEEVYFPIPVKAGLERDAREIVEVGDIAYWPPGEAMCIFFGPTPASQRGEIRAASRVNIVGRVKGDLGIFRGARDGAKIFVDKGVNEGDAR